VIGNNFIELNLLEDPLIPQYPYSLNLSDKKNTHTYRYISPIFIKKELKEQISPLGEIQSVVIFKKKPGYVGPLHMDVVKEEDRWVKWSCAINWDLTKCDSSMEWYETSLEEVWPEKASIDQGGYVLSGIHYGRHYFNKDVDQETCTLLESANILNPTLVRTDIPHRVVNNDLKVRWCISLRLKNNYSWEEAREIFKPFYL
jgi:hypothetical protein